MKRVLAILVTFAIVFVAMAVVLRTSSTRGYRVDALFNDVDFLIPGQDVRIAGATAGTVQKIVLTPDHQARVEMSITSQLGSFHTDADCTIEPQSLIGDRFVNCTPGTPQAPPLQPQGGNAPTLPATNTHSPVDLDLVLQTLNLPVRQRAALLLDGLGVGLAGNGANLNQAILEANPALQETRNVLGILNQNRAQLQSLISSSDVVLARLAQSRQNVRRFVRGSATVLNTTAANRGALAQAVVRLPPLLAQARPTLAQLSAFAREGVPASNELGAAAPSLNGLLSELQGFAPQVLPTVKELGATSATLQRALPSVAPQVHRLRTFSSLAPASGSLLSALTSSMRSSGAADGFLEFVYYAAAAFARYDTISHILPAYPLVTTCELYAATPTPGCNAHFSSAGGAAASDRGAARSAGGKPGRSRSGRSPSPRLRPAATAPPSPAPQPAGSPSPQPAASPAPAPTPGPAGPPTGNAISALLRFLLG